MLLEPSYIGANTLVAKYYAYVGIYGVREILYIDRPIDR
jgi:hypothetical protein